MDLPAKVAIRNTVLALAVSVIALLSFAQVSHALTQADVDFICGIFKCTDDQRARAEALIDEEGGDAPAPKLNRSLWRGMTGEEVTLLQEILASDPQIYPEALITGFFGPLTEKAVKNFQKRFGIEQVGGVGPITRATFNGIVAQGAGKSGRVPPGLLKKFGGATTSGTDDGNGTTTDNGTGTTTDNGTPSTSTAVGKVLICHAPPGNPANAKTISVGAPATGAHVGHGDVVGACGGTTGTGDGDNGDGNGEEDDTTAPVISGVLSQNVSSTTAEIFWETDENSDSTVWYSDSTPVDTNTADSETDGSDVTEHTIELSGLTASTTYHYFVGSDDADNNEATSTEESFITLSE